MKLKSIDQVRPLANHILVKVSGAGRNKMTLAGSEMKINTSYNPEIHTDPRGEVVSTCDHLEFYSKHRGGNFGTIPYETAMDINPGDIVWFDYLTYLECLADLYNPLSDFHLPKYILLKGELYIFVPFQRIYMRQRGEEMKMLNGWMMVRDLIPERAVRYMKIYVTPVEVVLNGEVNYNYQYKNKGKIPDDIKVDIGDKVILSKRYGVRKLEPWTQGEKEIKEVRIGQAKYIIAFIDGDVLDVLAPKGFSQFKIRDLSGMQQEATTWKSRRTSY